jgi:signal transduction histidine kinase
LLANEGDLVLYRVIDLRDGKVIVSNGDLGAVPDLPSAIKQPVFRDIKLGNKRLRVGSMRHDVDPTDIPVIVEIGETMGKRDRAAGAVLVATFLFMASIIAVAVGLVWQGVGRALAPLEVLEAEAAKRSGADLTPLDPLHAPEEVRGLIIAINRMMERVSSVMESQSHFIANAAHQLRTPLAGLRLQAQLGLAAKTPDAMRASLTEVEQSASRASRLVEQLLVLAKAETTDPSTEGHPVNLEIIAQQVIESYLPLADKCGVDLGYADGGGPAWAAGNDVLFAELLGNLVDNALRHGHQGGHVTVEVRGEPNDVLVTVSDDGPGFEQGEPDLIFTRFCRPDSSTRPEAGLGLAIVHEIAERYRGRVTLHSVQGEGSRFELRFPRVAA